MCFNCCKQYWESAWFRRAFSYWVSQFLFSYTSFRYAIKWHFFFLDANQGLLPLEGGHHLSEESGNAAILAHLITEPRAVVQLPHQKRKRRLLSQNPLWNQRRLLFKKQLQTGKCDNFVCRTIYYLLKNRNYLNTCLELDLSSVRFLFSCVEF